MTARTKEAAVLADCTQAALGYRFAQTWQQAHVYRVPCTVLSRWWCSRALAALCGYVGRPEALLRNFKDGLPTRVA